ncbi:MAG: hypothetical protein WCR27_04215 [Eubacteriales bacterium]
MNSKDWFWKAFEATGSPQVYLLCNSQKQKNNKNDDQDKRNATL